MSKFYVNTETKEIHKQGVRKSGCRKAEVLKKNRRDVKETEIVQLIKDGYDWCGHCVNNSVDKN